MIKLLLALAPVTLVVLSALPGVLIKRANARTAAQNVADFRDTLPPSMADLDPEQAEMDERWDAYWAASHREGLAIAERLTDRADFLDDLVATLEADAERITKRFITEALAACRHHANKLGGWRNDTEREADRWYTMAKVNHTTVGHLVSQEITDTRWTQRDTEALRRYADEQAALTAARRVD